jgi:ankyrin repeat protein
LCRQLCDADIRKCIATLPKGLPETYERLLSRIINSGKADIVNKIMRWTAAAKRPLLSGELREAIIIKPGDTILERDRLVNNIDGLVSWCGNLVTLDDEDDLIQFAHHTVKQFLLSKPYSAATAEFHFRAAEIDHAAGEACVTYLNFKNFQRQLMKAQKLHHGIQPVDFITSTVGGRPGRLSKYGVKLAGKFKQTKVDFDVMEKLRYTSGKDTVSDLDNLLIQYSFLGYAGEYWLSHTSGFTRQNTGLWGAWKQIVLTENALMMKPWTIDDDGMIKGPIFEYILDENHPAVLTCIFESGAEFDTYLDQGDFLFKAADRGMTQLVEAIIELDGFILSHGAAALNTAAVGGHAEIVERLVAANVDISTVGYDGRTPLQVAAKLGHVEVVESLLAAKADVNAAGSDGYTPLQAAAKGGYVDVVKMLLAAKADVNIAAAGYGGRTALQAAAECGQVDIVQRLLKLKAEVNAPPAEHAGRTALQAAAENGHLEIFEKLLKLNADVDAMPSEYDGYTALQAAAKGGHTEIVKTLLAAKAKVNAASSNGHTALQEASERNHAEIVKLLLMAARHCRRHRGTGTMRSL